MIRIFKRKSFSSTTLGLVVAALLSFAGAPVVAETADGDTPANEGVCDILQGGTPGLYGLCVAYCEAQDLDLVGDKETPNNKILANYRRKMNDGDPDMPCIQVPCPCWTAEELARIGSSGGSLSCSTSSTTAVFRSSSPTLFATIDTSRPLCRYTDTTTDPRISRRFDGFSDAEAQSCYDQVVQTCTDLGL
jgi:hypothetical protein